MFAALGATDKQSLQVEGASHYFSGPDGKAHLAQASTMMTDWLRARDLAA
jgi:hypothetical protein